MCSRGHIFARGLLACALTIAPLAASAGPPRDDEESRPKQRAAMPAPAAAAETVYDFDADAIGDLELAAPEMSVETVGVTAGGLRGIDLVRAQIEAGEIPRASLIKAEGLLSEHDLPLRTRAGCEQLLCIRAETVDTTMLTEPAVHYLTQLGFASDVDLSTLPRPPLNVVIVVDLSSSMAGAPINTARAAVAAIARELSAGDQLSIVGFGVEPRVYMPPRLSPDPSYVEAVTYQLEPRGATALERGLFTGFELARRSSRGFAGASRVVLITDDRPNVGRTATSPFLALARSAAASGVGLTTIGVGAQFNAALAYELSSVRGGNVLYLRSPEHARLRIGENFSGLVHELARALVIEIEPAPGMRVVDVYGVPGELLTREGDRVSLRVETLFVSKKRGAIYLALAPKGRANLPRAPVRIGAHLGRVSIRLRSLDGALLSDQVALRNLSPRRASPGLSRGALLVDEFTTMRAIGELYHEAGDHKSAYELARALAERFRPVNDDELQAQRELVLQLERTLQGRAYEAGESRLFALPR